MEWGSSACPNNSPSPLEESCLDPSKCHSQEMRPGIQQQLKLAIVLFSNFKFELILSNL